MSTPQRRGSLLPRPLHGEPGGQPHAADLLGHLPHAQEWLRASRSESGEHHVRVTGTNRKDQDIGLWAQQEIHARKQRANDGVGRHRLHDGTPSAERNLRQQGRLLGDW